MNNNTKAGLILLFLGFFMGIIPFSALFIQMILRLTYYGGSMDQLWLFIPIFWFSPFHIVPAICFFTGLVHKKSNGFEKYSKSIKDYTKRANNYLKSIYSF